jgi:hypothetical protein
MTKISSLLLSRKNSRGIFLFSALLLVLSLGAPAPALASNVSNLASLSYPRLCVWWPNNDTQSVAARARYDWIEMQWYDAGHIAELRAANPNIVLLTSNSGRELNYNSDYSNWTNVELRSASTDWLMTQVGSTLSGPISATTTSIPVADTTKFAVKDFVLVDHELMTVTAVGTSSLTVASRGVPEPATTHAVGARIAATISCWPGALEMDATTNCPKVDVGYGPETWNDWNVRRGVKAVAAADWDGVMIDCNDGSPSWWVGSYARSIDENRDNVADDLTALNSSWNIGEAAYGTALKAALGPNKIVAGNYAVTNFNINGRNWEGFPNSGTTPDIWHQQVLGPYTTPTTASYIEWLTNAQQPNVSTIQTYEYEGDIPAGSGWNDPANLYSGYPPPGFVPNYQRMRYGLATALMGDGFFSYELTTQGHACRALFWFDEYDNVGAGRGYLGQPLGSATNVLAAKPDLAAGDGAFATATQLSAWALDVNTGLAATKVLDTGTARINVATTGQIWQLGFQHSMTAVAGKTYEVTFRAKSSASYANLSAMIYDGTASGYTNNRIGDVGTDWQNYRVTIPVTHSGSGYFRFYFGDFRGTLWLDDIQIREANPEVWRRDYSDGIAIVNADDSARTVQLGGTFRKLKGNQAPSVNDGSLVTQVTLQPKDGIILLRVAAPVTYQLTYAAGANGTISGVSSQTVTSGGSGTAVTAVPDVGYHFIGWNDGATTAVRSDGNVLANKSFTASFAIDTHKLTYLAAAGGSISGATMQTVNYGANGTSVMAVPSSGYHFIGWSDLLSTASRTDATVVADKTVTANFAINTYTVTVTAGLGGAITPASGSVNYGSTPSYSIVPNSGYHVADVTINGVSMGAITAYRFPSITANVAISATFAANPVATATTLLLTSKSNASLAYGATFVVAGNLKSSNIGVAAQQIILQSGTSASNPKDTTMVTTTDAAGNFSFALTPASKTYYRVRFAGTLTYTATGPTVAIYATPKKYTGTPKAATTMHTTSSYTVTGYVMPQAPSGTYPVQIHKERYVNGGWKDYGYVNAKASDYSTYSKYAAKLRLVYRGRWRLRAYAPADATHAAAWSTGYSYVTVR